MKKILIATFFCFQALGAMAGTSSGKVTTLIVNASNYLFFNAGVKQQSPVCGNNDQWAINLSTPKGKSIYAMLLAAKAQDRNVWVYGNNTCDEWGDREDVLYAISE